jgi:hypothetical protein
MYDVAPILPVSRCDHSTVSVEAQVGGVGLPVNFEVVNELGLTRRRGACRRSAGGSESARAALALVPTRHWRGGRKAREGQSAEKTVGPGGWSVLSARAGEWVASLARRVAL